MNPLVLADVLHDVARTVREFPDANFRDAFSHGQLASKAWAVEQLLKLERRRLGCVFVLGGWYGVLPLMLTAHCFEMTAIRSFDIDPSCQPVADALNRASTLRRWFFKAVTADMFRIDYTEHVYSLPKADGSISVQRHRPDTIINTSCDHVQDFSRWWDLIPSGRLVLLQNNDFRDAGEDHVNTVATLGEFHASAPMAETLFAGELDLGAYRRFMLIGIK